MAIHPAKYDLPLTGLDWLEYYNKHNVYHPGLDYNFGSGNDDLGAPCWAIMDAEVEYVAPIDQYNGGFGNFIILYFPGHNVWARYAHLDQVFVNKGDKVKEGDKIATVGNTGTGYAHLHFELFNQDLHDDIKDMYNGPFRFYPSGKTKDWVQKYYINPWEFIQEEDPETALEWCKKHLKEVGDEGWDEINAVHEGLPEAFRSLAKRVKSWFT